MKNLLITLGTGIFNLIAGMITGQIFHFLIPSIQSEYENPQLFRPWSDPLMSLFFVVPIITVLIQYYIWLGVKDHIKAKSPVGKGLYFGLIFSLLCIPGMLMSYSSFPVSLAMVLSWTFSNIVQSFLTGLIFSRFIK